MTSFADGDRIILSGLAFYGYHGVMLEENKLGQRFRLDLEVGLDLSPARNDSVEATISYADIYEVTHEAFEGTRFKLIEALAHHIVARLFETFDKLDWVRVRIRKPEAPLPIVAGEAAIEIVRTREQM